jgi:hypothetical protein
VVLKKSRDDLIRIPHALCAQELRAPGPERELFLTCLVDWGLVTKHADVLRFVKLLIARRVLRDREAESERVGLEQFLREAKVTWHGGETRTAGLD